MTKFNPAQVAAQAANAAVEAAKAATANAVSVRELYIAIDGVKKDLGDKIDNIDSRVSNIEGRLLIYTVLVSTAFSGFFLIVSKLIK